MNPRNSDDTENVKFLKSRRIRPSISFHGLVSHFLGVNSLAASARPAHLDFVSIETIPLKHNVVIPYSLGQRFSNK